jgi:N-acetyl-alpha-D-muramate 1-phosphate uridylyltransferase
MSQTTQWRPQTAFVLAAGLGTRMRPLTDAVPKPMVALHGVTLIDRVLDRLADAGITQAVVNVHYLADVLEAHLATRAQPHIMISDERGVLLDTGGGVMRARSLLGDQPFLIHNSDSVWIEGVGRNLDRLCAAWNPVTMDSVMLLATGANSIGYEGNGDFDMDAEGRLSRRGERREVPFVFAGVSIAHPRLFEDAPQGRFSLNRVWDRAIDRGRLFGIRLEGLWMHVGTPQAVIEAQERMALEGEL